MPHKYKRLPGSRTYADFTPEKLEKCLEAVRSRRMTQREAEKFYKISRATIKRKLKNQHSGKPGHPRVFTDEEELAFASHLNKLCDFGFPCDELDFKFVIKAYLGRQGRTVALFKNNLPGRDWVKSFLHRHPSLSVRFAANIKRARAAVDERVISEYIQNVGKLLKDTPPENVYNYDETNMSDDPGRKKIICRRGTKYPERIMNTTKSSISVMFCGNAAGQSIPPYIIYKAENLWTTWTEGGPPGAKYNRSKHGWIDLLIFEDWFTNHLLPILKKQEGRKVVIGDNLTSHLSMNVIQLCDENNVHFVCLPPNSSHLTQPLDVAYFRPLKMKWKAVLDRWKQSDAGKRIGMLPKDQFPMLLRTVLEEIGPNLKSSLKAGFKKAGLVPIDENQIISRLPNQDKSKANADLSMIGDAFLQRLQEKRGEFVTPRTTKKKKLQVPPGQSVSVSDFFSSSVSVENSTRQEKGPKVKAPSKKTKNNIRKRQILEDSTSEEDDVFSLRSGGDSDISLYNSDEEHIGQLPMCSLEVKSSSTPVPVMKDDLEIDNFVLVKWNEKEYPGIILAIEAEGVRVDCMEPTLKAWRWPKNKDVLLYKFEDVVKKIQPPKLIKRGLFSLTGL